MSKQESDIIKDFFLAMQTGATAEVAMMALFAEDAVYVEPFSGKPRTHRGKPAIRQALRQGWEKPLPDMQIRVDRVEIAGDQVRALWSCLSPALPGGIGKGENHFTLRDGLILRLETRFLPAKSTDDG